MRREGSDARWSLGSWSDTGQVGHPQGLGTGSQCPWVSFPEALEASPLKELQKLTVWNPQVRGDRWKPLFQAQQSQLDLLPGTPKPESFHPQLAQTCQAHLAVYGEEVTGSRKGHGHQSTPSEKKTGRDSSACLHFL